MTVIDTGNRTFNVENMLRAAIRQSLKHSPRRSARFVATDLFCLGSSAALDLMVHLGLDTETGKEIVPHCRCGNVCDSTGYCDECLGG